MVMADDSFFVNSPSNSSRVAEFFIQSLKRERGKDGGSRFGIETDVRFGMAKPEGLVFCGMMGGEVGRTTSISEDEEEIGVSSFTKCPGRMGSTGGTVAQATRG